MKTKSKMLGTGMSPVTLLVIAVLVVGLLVSVLAAMKSQYLGTDASVGSGKGPQPSSAQTRAPGSPSSVQVRTPLSVTPAVRTTPPVFIQQ